MGSETQLGNCLDVLFWPEEMILKNIEYAITKVKEIMESGDDTRLEYIVFALENIIQHIPVCSVEEKILHELCCAVEDIFITTLSGLESNLECSIKLSQFNSKEALLFLLVICNKIMHSFHIVCANLCAQKKIQYNNITKFIACSKQILCEGFDYYNRNNATLPELNLEFYDELCQFNFHFWRLITLVVDFDSNKSEDVDVIYDLLHVLETEAKNSFLKPKVQLVECWKNLLNFIERNQDIISNANKFQVNSVIIHIANYLIIELEDTGSLNNDCGKNELQNLKIYNFLLKIIVKLSKTHKDELNECNAELVSLLLILYRTTPSYLRASNFSQASVCEINRYVVMASDPLLSVICTSDKFLQTIKTVLQKNSIENPYGSTIFLISLLKKINNSKMKELYFSETFNIIEVIFNSYGLCNIGLLDGKLYAPGSAVTQIELKKDLYEYVFNALTVFTLSLTPDEFILAEKTFLRNVIQVNPWKAILASDIWCLVARYANVQVCHATLDTLILFLSKIDSNSARPEFIQLLWLVQRLLQFCEPKYLDSIVLKYPFEANILLWKNLGTHTNILPNSMVRYLTKVIQNWVDNENHTLEGYQCLETSLHVLARCPSSNELNSALIDHICRLWSVGPLPVTSAIWTNFRFSLTSLTTAIVSKMQPQQISAVVAKMRLMMNKSHTFCDEFSILLLLKSLFGVLEQFHLFPQETTKNIVSVFKCLINSDSPIVSTISLGAFSDLAHNSSFSHIVELIGCDNVEVQNKLVNFLQKNLPAHCKESLAFSSNQYVHDCSHFKKIHYPNFYDEGNPKRMKRNYSNDIFNETVDRLEKDTIFIADNKCFLDSTQREKINSILLTLSGI